MYVIKIQVCKNIIENILNWRRTVSWAGDDMMDGYASELTWQM